MQDQVWCMYFILFTRKEYSHSIIQNIKFHEITLKQNIEMLKRLKVHYLAKTPK